jgi:hypothetical protein
LTYLPLEDLLLERAPVSSGLLLDEAWNAEPAILDEFVGQGTGALLCTVVKLVEDVVDGDKVWAAILVTQVWLAVRTEALLTRLTGQMNSSNAFDREVARVEIWTWF